MSEDLLRAPWAPQVVAALNRYQHAQVFIPYTCGGQRGDGAHAAHARAYGQDMGLLQATPDGWVCPVCDYRQDWAHVWSAADMSKMVSLPLIDGLSRPEPSTCSPAELERAALLIEEAAEVIQAVAKILRFGAGGLHPGSGETGRDVLERELGDLKLAIRLAAARGDVRTGRVDRAAAAKAGRIGQFLRHNRVDDIVADPPKVG